MSWLLLIQSSHTLTCTGDGGGDVELLPLFHVCLNRRECGCSCECEHDGPEGFEGSLQRGRGVGHLRELLAVQDRLDNDQDTGSHGRDQSTHGNGPARGKKGIDESRRMNIPSFAITMHIHEKNEKKTTEKV